MDIAKIPPVVLEAVLELQAYEVEHYLRPRLSGSLGPDIISQLELILEQQFAPDNLGEVGGCIYVNDDSLRFEIVESAEMKRLKDATKKLMGGEVSEEDISFLKLYFDILMKSQKPFLQESSITHDAVEILEQEFKKGYHKIVSGKPELRESIARLYTIFVINHLNIFKLSDYTQGYSAIFHVHGGGSPPSPKDLALHQEVIVAGLVISAKRDYATQGLTLHLIHSGAPPDKGYETLYQGPLHPQQLPPQKL